MPWFSSLFSSDFMPHGVCYLWDPRLVWLHVISDGLIALSYYCIPVILIYFIRKNRDLPLNNIFWMFGSFILACGTTHLMEIWNIWHGSYLIAGIIKAITATVSVLTAAMLVPLVPKVMSLPERMYLQGLNRKLEQEIAERKRFDAPTDAPLRRRVMTGFIVAILLTAFIGISAWRGARRAEQDDYWVSHTHEVMEAIQRVSRHLIETDTSARSFALTGQEPLLVHYQAARTKVIQDQTALRHLTADNPSQQRRLDVLDPKIRAALEFADIIIAKRRQSQVHPGGADALEIERLLDEERVISREMYSEEQRLLQQRTQRANAGHRLTKFIAVIGALLGAGLWILAKLAVDREIAISERARAQLSTLNAELERRVAQRTEALGESEGRLAGIIQSATDSIISVDEEQRIVLFNTTAERTFRCPAAEAVGQPLTRFIPQRFHAGHAGHVRKFGNDGVTNRAMGAKGVLWAVRDDGHEFQIEASISQVVTSGKNLYTVILRDVTERVQAAEARERLAAIVDSSDDAIISKTLEGVITAWNHGAEKVFGYSAAEAVGQPMAMLVPPERMNEELEILARIGRRESVEHFETIRMRKDGKRINVSATISPIRDVNGVVVGSSKVARDISERKRTEAALRESNSRRKFALETAKLGDWELDLTTLQAHRSLLHDQIFGYQSPLPEWNLDIFLSHVHAEERKSVRENFQTCISQEKPWDFECRIVWPSGDIRWIWACGDHYRDQSGGSPRMFGIVEDITERKQAEEALGEKEHLLSESQRIAHVGSWSLDLSKPDGRIIWSEELYRIYGVSPQTFIPTMESLLSLVVPDDRATMHRWVVACAGGEQPSELEFRITLPDGRIRFITGRGELQLDESQRPVRIAGSAQDVTERKQAQEEFRESEARFHAMLNGIPQLAWMANPGGDIFWYNQRWYDYTGTNPNEMEGWGWQRVHDPAVLPKVMEEWKASIADGTEFEMEFPLRAADGHFGTFLTRIMPLKDEEGHVVRWFGTNTDISDRKQAEEQLSQVARELAQKAEELEISREAFEAQTVMLKLVLDNMGEGLIAADQQGHFLVWNNAAHNLMGRGAEDLSTEQWTEHYSVLLPDGITPYPPDRLPLVRALRGESVCVELIVQPPANLQATFLEVTARPLMDARGAVCGGVAVLRDVTQSREHEREIRQLNDELEIRVTERTAQLEIANRELEAFSYSVSHDLRAPLRHIAGFSKMLVEDFGATLDPGAKHYLDRIQAGTQRMGLLVDELLGLARVGRHPLNRQPAKLNAIVDDVITLLGPDAQGRHVQWRIADLPVVECDQVLVRQIFQNLLANALKFTRMRDPAVIEAGHTEQEDGGLVFYVRDNGIGFDMNYVDKLFGVFQRLHREEDFEGTGIGLATVQRIVHKHGGRAWAEGEVGKGATFYFTLGVGKAEAKSSGAMAGGQS